MFKTLSAALIAASVMLAPMAVSANAAPAPAASKQVTMVKKHARHVVRHHKRAKFAKHARHFRKHFAHKRTMKIVKAHKRAHVVAAKARIRAN